MDGDWDDTPAKAVDLAAVEPEADLPEIKLFGKWSCDEVNVSDMSLQDYIAVKEKYAKYLPHSSGRYAAKRFRKAQCPIVERLVNSLMMHGRNNGKKLLTVRIVKHSFEIIHLLTGEVSIDLNFRIHVLKLQDYLKIRSFLILAKTMTIVKITFSEPTSSIGKCHY